MGFGNRACVFLAFSCLTIVISFAGGCGGGEGGAVYVSQPEVFTRERLVNERLRETQFLENKLDPKNAPEFSFQGLEDRSVVTYFMDKLSLQYSPTGFGNSGSDNSNQSGGKGDGTKPTTKPNDSEKTSSPGSGSSSGITINNTNSNKMGSGGGGSNDNKQSTSDDNSGGAKSGNDPSKGQDQQGDKSGSSKDSSASSGYDTWTPPSTMPSGKNAAQTTAKLTPIELLNDQMAYRDAVNAALQEKMLDDTHDLKGLTLYTLKFDLTVVPGRHATKPLLVLMKLQDRPWDDENGTRERQLAQAAAVGSLTDQQKAEEELTNFALYRNWVTALDREIQFETLRAEARLTQDQLSDDELALVARELKTATGRLPGSDDVQKATTQATTPATAPAAAPTTAPASAPASATPASLPRLPTTQLQAEIESVTDTRRTGLPDRNAPPTTEASRLDATLEAVTRFIIESHTQRIVDLQDTKIIPSLQLSRRDTLKYAVARWVWLRYKESLHNLVYCPDPIGLQELAGNEQFFINEAIPVTWGRNHFYSLMADLENSLLPRAFAIEPKEYAQNISDVAARQDIVDLSLALSAAFSQANVSNTTRAFKESQAMLQSIKRQPLAIGFGDGKQQFGWLLGPRFLIDRNLNVSFEHTPIRHSFSCEIGVPAWWAAAALSGQCFWVEDDGSLTPAAPPAGSLRFDGAQRKAVERLRPGEIWPAYSPSPSGSLPRPVPESLTEPQVKEFRTTTFLRLPTDPAAITTAFLYSNDRTQLQPALDVVRNTENGGNDSPEYSITTDKQDQTLLIRGRNLWRNPRVFIGNVPAVQCEVLPDMEGLLAHFDNLSTPPEADDGKQLLDLTVVTTFGSDTLARAVKVVQPAPEAKKAAFLTLNQHWALIGDTLPFSVDSAAFPGRAILPSLVLRWREQGSGAAGWSNAKSSVSVGASNGTISFSPPPAGEDKPKVGIPLVSEVDVETSNFDALNSVLKDSPQSLVVYATEGDRELVLTGFDPQPSQKPKINIALPTAGEKLARDIAYADLLTAAKSAGAVTVVLEAAQELRGTALVEGDRITSVDFGKSAPPADNYSVLVEWKTAQGATSQLAVKGTIDWKPKSDSTMPSDKTDKTK